MEGRSSFGESFRMESKRVGKKSLPCSGADLRWVGALLLPEQGRHKQKLRESAIIIMRVAMLLPLLSAVHASICLAQTVSIKVPEARVRSGPGINFDVLWSAGKFYPLQVLSQNGNWYRVKDFQGKVGWVHQEQTSSTRTVVVKVGWANVRSGPGPHYPVRLIAEQGSAFHLIREVDHWVQVGYIYGKMGWIDRELLWGWGRNGEHP